VTSGTFGTAKVKKRGLATENAKKVKNKNLSVGEVASEAVGEVSSAALNRTEEKDHPVNPVHPV
jgi:hypothetical protein